MDRREFVRRTSGVLVVAAPTICVPKYGAWFRQIFLGKPPVDTDPFVASCVERVFPDIREKVREHADLMFAMPHGIGFRAETDYLPVPSAPTFIRRQVKLNKVMLSIEEVADD